MFHRTIQVYTWGHLSRVSYFFFYEGSSSFVWATVLPCANITRVELLCKGLPYISKGRHRSRHGMPRAQRRYAGQVQKPSPQQSIASECRSTFQSLKCRNLRTPLRTWVEATTKAAQAVAVFSKNPVNGMLLPA